ncbi:MAG: tetratricopeptide repeat protein [Solirubrobacterales bacterium]
MKDDNSIFGASPEGFDRLVFEAWQNPEADQQDQPTIPAQMLLEQPGGQIGRYKLLSILGEGGMGIVYLAEQDRPVKRHVALKVIKPGMDSKRVLARFEAEQQALALMEHPHVARVHDAGLTPSGRPYFVMEYVRGVPITEYCDKHRLTVEERLRLFLHVCEAVQHAHQKGVIHRDLKPSNILVTVEDAQATPKVIDFGVARAISQPLTERTLHTELGQLVGTPEYMSPEQADLGNQDIDTRTDVYSLGVVLYELIAGVLPFDPHALREQGIDGVRKVICEQDPQTPSTKLSRTGMEESTRSAQQRRMNIRQLQRTLRGDLDWITLRAMAKDRTRRYCSAGELAADILRYLNHETVTADRPGLVYTARKFVCRHRALVSGVAAVLTVLLAGLIVSLVFAFRAQRARDEATAVAEFLQEDVFGTFDGWDLGGQQITIGDFLDAASKKVPGKFSDAPLQEAAIRKTLGALYLKVNRFDDAELHLRRSLDIFTRELGRQDRHTLDVVDQLGQMYWHQWQYDEAERYLSESLQHKRRFLGSEHPDTLQTMGWLGWACYGNGEAKRAVSLLAEAYETARCTRGDRDRITLECMFYYGSALLFHGQNADAERILEDALRLSQGVLKPAHPWVGYPTALLGRLYSQRGRYEDASKLLNSALAVSRDAWGEVSGGTFHNMVALAENYARQGLTADAETLLLDSVRRDEQAAGSQRPVTVPILTYLSSFYLWQKRYDEAEHWLNKALAVSLTSYGEKHAFTWLSRIELATVYQEQGRYEEADKQLANVADFTATTAEVAAVTSKTVGTANVMHHLAALRQRQARYAEAEKLHLKTLEIQRSELVEDHPHTLGTIRGLVALYAAWDNQPEAHKWLAELRTAYARQAAAHQQLPAVAGSIHYDPAIEAYTLAAPAACPWTMEKELNFSYPDPSSEMWHVCDDLHFAHKMLQGDGSITAKVESITPIHYGSQVVLMIRDALDPTAPQASLVVTPLGEILFQGRTVDLGATQRIGGASSRIELPHWLRLIRRGNQVTAQHSGDGATWLPVQDSRRHPATIEIPMGETAYIGIGCISSDPSRAAEARVCNVTISGAASPSGSFDELRHIDLRDPSSADRPDSR